MKKVLIILGCSVIAPLGVANESLGRVVTERGISQEEAVVELMDSGGYAESDQRGPEVLPDISAKEQQLHGAADAEQYIFHLHNPQQQASQLMRKAVAWDVINVVALPWHASHIESAQPINVLDGKQLRRDQAATLGDTLKYQAGVHSSYYGPAASSPIIRGLDGPRVLVVQNGLDAGDASRVGPDHAVATEASTARQIEILRGPATLFYGSGAIGGVVNIVDDRIPKNNKTQGEWRLEHGSVASENLLSGSITTAVEKIAIHADGFSRDASDYKIPGSAQPREGGRGSSQLSSSAYDAQGLNLGASYLLDTGFVGLAVGHLERNYGIPGHSHGEGENVPVHAELEQDRIQLISELTLDLNFISAINTRIGYTDYAHNEIEKDEVATTFANKSYEVRIDAFHHPVADWRGATMLHYKRSDFSAVGAEAFTPPSITDSWALALVEERRVRSLLLQVGGRIERVNISADNFIADIGQRYQGKSLSVYAVEYEGTPFSFSAGSVWDFSPGYNLALSFTHAQRVPSAAELLSFGPHIGSGLFEAGALLTVNPQPDDSFYFDLQRRDISLERSNNIDISLRKFQGNIGFNGNIFYNHIDNYYFLNRTLSTQKIAEAHGDHFHYFTMPVFNYQSRDASLHGFEGQLIWQLAEPLSISFTGDYIRAKLRDGDNLPRIPPLRAGGRINYQRGDMELEFSATHYFRQNQAASQETDTDGYTLLDLQVSYELARWVTGVELYIKGQNLSNEYARVHSSFLKDKAPLPARSVAVGISGIF